MLKVFRENLKHWHWVLWLVIAVFILLVFVDFGGARLQGPVQDDVVATVGKRSVSLGEFQRQYRQLEDQVRSTYGDAFTQDLADQLQLPWRAVNDLVSQEILLLEGERMGLEPTAAEVRRAILQVPVFQKENGTFVGGEEYERILRANRLSVSEFESDMRQQVLLDKVRSVLADTIWVSDGDVERIAREQAERASIRYLRLQPAELGGEVTVEQEELAQYFEEHREVYRLPERRRVSYLSINVNTIRAGLEIDESELRAYYDANPEEFTQEEQVRARHILLFSGSDRTPEAARREIERLRSRIESGEDFATLARELSEDEGSKARGGDLGYFGRGRMTPAFEQAAFDAEVGTLVGPVENQLGNRTGFHLVEVIDKREGGLQSFEDVSNRIRVRLFNDRSREEAERLARDLAARLGEEAPGTDDELRSLAEQEGVALEVTEPFARDENVPGIGQSTPFAIAAFDLEPGVFSEPVRIPAGWAIPVVREITPPRVPELAEVEEQVRADLVRERQEEVASQRLAELEASISNGEKSFDDVAAELGAEVQDGGEFAARGSVRGLGSQRELTAAALELEAGEVGGPISTPQGLILFEVTDRKHFDPATFEATKQTERERLQSQRLNEMLAALVAERRVELEVSYSQWFVDSFQLSDAVGISQL